MRKVDITLFLFHNRLAIGMGNPRDLGAQPADDALSAHTVGDLVLNIWVRKDVRLQVAHRAIEMLQCVAGLLEPLEIR